MYSLVGNSVNCRVFFPFIFTAIIYCLFPKCSFICPCRSRVTLCVSLPKHRWHSRCLQEVNDSPKPGSSSGLCSRGLQRRTMSTKHVANYWYSNMQQKARDCGRPLWKSFFVVIFLLNLCCPWRTTPKQARYSLELQQTPLWMPN